jgi:hypothetical protein
LDLDDQIAEFFVEQRRLVSNVNFSASAFVCEKQSAEFPVYGQARKPVLSRGIGQWPTFRPIVTDAPVNGQTHSSSGFKILTSS